MRFLLPIFFLSIFLSAGLLFLIQPLAAKILLPLLGGSPAVWNTCMVFFQGVLLLGYGYSHILTTYFAPRTQAVIHIALLLFVGLSLPIPIDVGEPGTGQTSYWLLKTLLLTVGLPFFIVSTTGPLLQRWFSTTSHPQAKDPYFLYAASNAGSIIGLLSFPALLEPFLTRSQQSITYTIGYAMLAPLVVACSILSLKLASSLSITAPLIVARSTETRSPSSPAPAEPLTSSALWKRRASWLLFAFVPSSLLLGVTQYITTDLAPVPLLWIVPLLLYLLTFIIAFSPRIRISAAGWGRVVPLCAIALLVGMLLNANHPMSVLATIHLIFFTVATLMCHKRLAESRPPAARLTEFYFIMSLGGVLGGIFNALIAPIAFPELFEYPIAIGLILFLRPQLATEQSKYGMLLRWGLSLVGALAISVWILNVNASIDSGQFARLNFPFLTRQKNGDHSFAGFTITLVVLAGIFRAGVPALACLLLLWRSGSTRFALAVVASLACVVVVGEGTKIRYKIRTFFGIHKVSVNERSTWTKLAHGTTIHGTQSRLTTPPANLLTPPPQLSAQERFDLFYKTIRTPTWVNSNFNLLPLIPTTYYHPSGPIGEVFKMLTEQGRVRRVALVGMGAGTLAAYAVPNSRFTFYEIDRAVINISAPATPYSNNWFTFIADAIRDPSVQVGVEEGDGRLRLRETAEGPFDLIVLDAFSSDAIPVHLVTREAITIYLSKLQPNGLIAFHISNRYFDLRNPLARIATDLNLKVFVRNDSVVTSNQLDEGKSESLWVVMARETKHFLPLAKLPNWESTFTGKSFPLWTDDHANVLGSFISDRKY